MLREQPRPAAFRQRDINQRHNGTAQIENSQHIAGRERYFRHQRPFQNLFHIENREAETLASAAKNAVLRFRPAISHRLEGFEQFANFRIGGNRCQLEVIANLSYLLSQLNAKRGTPRKSSSSINGYVT